MAGKVKFDQEAAFKSIIGVGETQGNEKQTSKGRPKEVRETKKRVSLALFPSIYTDIQKIAYVDRKSVSDLLSNLMEKHIAENVNKLKEYEKIKPE